MSPHSARKGRILRFSEKPTAPTTIWETDKRPSKQLHQNSPSASDAEAIFRNRHAKEAIAQSANSQTL